MVDQKKSYGFRLGDLLAVGAVLLLGAMIFLLFLIPGRAQGGYARIYREGELLHTLSLEEDRVLTVEGKYSCTVTVEDGAVAVTRSNCPGEDCVHSGWIDSPGRSIICLPNGLEIRVVGKDSDVDFVVR